MHKRPDRRYKAAEVNSTSEADKGKSALISKLFAREAAFSSSVRTVMALWCCGQIVLSQAYPISAIKNLAVNSIAFVIYRSMGRENAEIITWTVAILLLCFAFTRKTQILCGILFSAHTSIVAFLVWRIAPHIGALYVWYAFMGAWLAAGAWRRPSVKNLE